MRSQLFVQGGDDMTVVAARHGGWYARLFRKPGKETREGTDVAGMLVGVRHDNYPVIVDVGGGWGAAAVGAAHVTRHTLRKCLIFLGCDGVTLSLQYERQAAANCAR